MGGKYFFTSDEVELHGDRLFLTEGKHTKTDNLPSLGDIKDRLLRMILLTNLKDVRIGDAKFNSVPVLKLTTGSGFKIESRHREILNGLKEESLTNGFKIMVNSQYV